MPHPPVIAIGGPTGVGKTALAIRIAQQLKTEIISVDSRQIYKELSIGVGRPNEEELHSVPHHFIASHSIYENFTAKDFQNQARAKAREIIQNYGSVILVGGTGLYYNAFFNGFDEFSNTPQELRNSLNQEFAEFGLDALSARLIKLDPVGSHEIDLKNPMRVIRALELILTHDKPLSEIAQGKGKAFESESALYFLNIERKDLYAQINSRVDKMIQMGFIEEAQGVYEHRELNPLKTVGYTEIFNFFNGNCTQIEAIEKMKQKTRNYAKRQITWFKNQWNVPELNSQQILNQFK